MSRVENSKPIIFSNKPLEFYPKRCVQLAISIGNLYLQIGKKEEASPYSGIEQVSGSQLHMLSELRMVFSEMKKRKFSSTIEACNRVVDQVFAKTSVRGKFLMALGAFTYKRFCDDLDLPLFRD